ncbi:SHOCT-like domain-containing protein [Actinomadura gamaensis]|uniref:YvlB/LiaX N-terminal domain-containing protein n=1 Tax=Actinomadura gamaensis TaxID=1763541 RepID=A0ABV9TUC4_9ACTN
MNEQRRQILQMLADGKVTADEAERLLDAVERKRPEPPPAESRPPARPRYLRVVVIADDPGEDGPTRINIRIPLQLLRAGVRLASLVPPGALGKVNEELARSGVPIDLADLKPEHVEEFIDQLAGVVVDLDDAESKVQVFCE